ncbi:hypothetical protein [Erythrobacter sp. NAP1]|uniref:hypothetical protein n=1 Tax=Erythrobacter sp. NAP1 TaxID=237727 RepID=UPI0002D63B4B|nr:hypothetical protein [Erythrobacter sp. NAP1]
MLRHQVTLLLITLLLVGCVKAPPVSVSYYLPKTSVSVSVIATAACDASGQNPIVSVAVTPTATHHADLAPDGHKTIDLTAIQGGFSNTDIKVGFREDGRISSLNSTSEGRGGEILKTTISLVSKVAGIGQGFQEECEKIVAYGGGKPISLKFHTELDLSHAKKTVPQVLQPAPESSFYFNELRSAIGDFYAGYCETTAPVIPISHSETNANLLLHARQPGSASVRVVGDAGHLCDLDQEPLWAGQVPVAQFGVGYTMPIPRSPAFGKQVFSVTFAESGALEEINYATNEGSSSALGVVNEAIEAASSSQDSTATILAETKAEADLIVQQQRLVQCLADPANCE